MISMGGNWVIAGAGTKIIRVGTNENSVHHHDEQFNYVFAGDFQNISRIYAAGTSSKQSRTNVKQAGHHLK